MFHEIAQLCEMASSCRCSWSKGIEFQLAPKNASNWLLFFFAVMGRDVLVKWPLLETTAYVEWASPMILKLQVMLPELLIVTLWYFAEEQNGCSQIQ